MYHVSCICMYHISYIMYHILYLHVSYIMCYVSHVTYHVSCITCHIISHHIISYHIISYIIYHIISYALNAQLSCYCSYLHWYRPFEITNKITHARFYAWIKNETKICNVNFLVLMRYIVIKAVVHIYLHITLFTPEVIKVFRETVNHQ
jgi:hypothetical protein